MNMDDRLPAAPGPFRALSPLIATISTTFMGSVASSVWLPAYAKIFGFGPATMGLIGSVQFAMSAIVMLFLAPRLLRRFQPRTLILTGLAAMILAEVLTVLLNPGAPAFILLRAIEGFGIGIATAASGLLASFTANPTRTFGVLQLSQGVAITVLFGLATLILGRFGILGIFGFLGLGALAAAPFALATPRIGLASLEAGSAVGHRVSAPFPVLGFVVLMAIFIVNVGTSTHMGDFGMRIGMNVAQVSVILALAGAVSIVSSLMVTVMAGRVAVWILLAVAAVIAAAGLIGLGMAGTPTALMVAACAMVFGNTLATPAVIAMVSASDNTGRAASAAQAAIVTGTALAPACGGAIESFLSLNALSVVFAVVIPVALVTAALLASRPAPAASIA
jgi:MFS family permease